MIRIPLHVLCIEDTAADAELVEAHLSLHDFDVVLERVETAEQLKKCLQEKHWDIALADYSLPKFNAVMAMEIIKASGRDLPVIIVSGTIGENRAIEMMRAGANDFIIKGDFMRLIPAIRRELKEAQNRKARRQAEAALELSQTSFKHLADAMPQLVWTASPSGRLTYMNSRAYSFLGINEEKLASDTSWIYQITTPESIQSYKEKISLGVEFSIEHNLRRADGQLRWFLTRATPARDLNGHIVTWYATTTDIHEQKMVADELEAAKIQAEEASAAKSAFLANMSHEIRTPLGAVLGFAHLMEDPDQTEAERMDCILRIKRNGEILHKTINEILDLSKIESQKLEIDPIEFNLPEIIEDVRTILEIRAQEKALSLQFISDGSLPETVITDPMRLRQIMVNIVGNAVKFTDRGGIKVWTRVLKKDSIGSKAMLEIQVQDTGIGISKEQSKRLFQPFVQGDNSTTRRYGGTGLGLSLSQKLAQVLGGDLILSDSQIGKGSTFICTIAIELPSNTVEAIP